MRVIVCGGRDLEDEAFVFSHLDRIDEEYHITTIINGGARGTDYISTLWASKRRKNVDIYEADWDKLGKKAGIMRNQQMLSYAAPDMVIAFAGGKGTANMVKIAKKAGVPVIEIEDLAVPKPVTWDGSRVRGL
jgi:hypothetical protein